MKRPYAAKIAQNLKRGMFFRVAFMLDEHIKISASIAEPGFVKQIREKLPQIRLDKTVFTDFQGFQVKGFPDVDREIVDAAGQG